MNTSPVTMAEAIAAAGKIAADLRTTGDPEAAGFLEELIDRARPAIGLPPTCRTGRVVLADLGPDGPAFVLGTEPPGSHRHNGEEVLAEYLIDPDDVAGSRYVRLAGRLELVPVTRDEAAAFIAEHHRRHPRRPAGWRFGVGVARSGVLVGVAWAGNPTARRLDDGRTLELQRLAVRLSRNAATKLIGAVARAARALGFERLITYTGIDEEAGSVKAAGFVEVAVTRGGQADRPGRRRSAVEDAGPKRRWLLEL